MMKEDASNVEKRDTLLISVLEQLTKEEDQALILNLAPQNAVVAWDRDRTQDEIDGCNELL